MYNIKEERLAEFLSILYFVEGGYSNHPKDKGGETCFGITQKTYNSFCALNKIEQKSVQVLSERERFNFYQKEFYSRCAYHDNKEIHYHLFDSFVNGGPRMYKNLLASVLRHEANKSHKNIDIYFLRRQFYKKIALENPEYGTIFLNGWNNRLKKIRNFFLGEL